MDRIEKLLRKITAKERSQIQALLLLIQANDLSGLDVKQLQGYTNIFRVRRGNFRIIFQKSAAGARILEVTKRSDTTHSKY